MQSDLFSIPQVGDSVFPFFVISVYHNFRLSYSKNSILNLKYSDTSIQIYEFIERTCAHKHACLWQKDGRNRRKSVGGFSNMLFLLISRIPYDHRTILGRVFFHYRFFRSKLILKLGLENF